MSGMICGLIIDFDKIWWGICRSLLYIVDVLGKSLEFILGAAPLSTDANGQAISSNDLLNTIFRELFWTNESGSVTGDPAANGGGIYWVIMGFCMLLMIVFVIAAVIKANLSKDSSESLGKMIGKGTISLAKMILIPFIFLIGIRLVGYIFAALIAIMSEIGNNAAVVGSGAGSTSLAQKIAEACCLAREGGRPIGVQFNMTYEEFQAVAGSEATFSYLMCIAASAFCVVTLVTCCISLVKRIIEVFFYYLTAPAVLSKSVLDEGKSFDLWKENVFAKLLGAGGIIIGLYLFYAILPKFVDTVDAAIESGMLTYVVGQTLKIVFIIGASTVPASGTMMFAQLISQGAGQNEANSLQHTQQMMGNAFRTAAAVGGKVLAGGLMAGGGALAGGTAGAQAAGGILTGMAGVGGTGGSFNVPGGNAPTNAGALAAPLVGRGPASAAASLAGAAPAGAAAVGGAGGNYSNAMSGGSAAALGSAEANSPVPMSTSAGQTSGSGASTAPSGDNFLSALGTNAKQAWASGAKGSYSNQSLAYLGLAGMAGSFLARNIRRGANLLKAIPQAAKTAWDSGRAKGSGLTRAEDRALRREARITQSQAGTDFKQSLRATEVEKNAGKAEGALNYMDKKLADFEKRTKSVEANLARGDKRLWTDDQKQAYRQQMLGSEYSALGQRLNAAENRARNNYGATTDKFNEGFGKRLNRFAELNPKKTNDPETAPKGGKK